MTERDPILERLDRLEQDLSRERTRARVWQFAALAGLALLVLAPASVNAGKAKSELVLASPDGRQEAVLSAQGYEFRYDGQIRANFDIGGTFGGLTMFRQDGTPAISFGSDNTGTHLRIFSGDQVRVTLSDELPGQGSGVQLYDAAGQSRATLSSGKADGPTGLSLTDGDHQPRLYLASQPNGPAVLNMVDSDAQAMVEISVLRRSDATYRELGWVAPTEHDPLVPMLYLLDPSGQSRSILAANQH